MPMYLPMDPGFAIGSDSYIDKRLLLTKAEMLTIEDDFFMPDRYIAFCLDDSKWYEFNIEFDEDPETGKYRELKTGIVKDVLVNEESVLDSEGIAHIEIDYPVEDVLVDGESVVENKKAQIDLTGKQDKLIAGDNITITSNVISATNIKPLEGEGIKVDSEGHISIDPMVVPTMDTLPADVESITDSLGLIDKYVLNLENYYLKDETYTRDEILNLLSSISGGITLEVVAVLPITGESNIIYLVRRSIDSNIYDQYVWFNNSWVQVGSTEVDLSQYYTRTEIDTLLNSKQNVLTAGNGIDINNNVISVDPDDLPTATSSRYGLMTYDNITIKKNSDGQLYAVTSGGGGGGSYLPGENIYFTNNNTVINAESYTAGDGITITAGKVVKAKVDDETIHTNQYGELYMDAIAIDAGDGITIQDGTIKVDRDTVPTVVDLDSKQDKLIAGDNIQITGNVISATGSGGGTADSVNWGHIYGNINNQADLQAALGDKANLSDIPTQISAFNNDIGYVTNLYHDPSKQDKLTPGANITITSEGVISATGGGGSGPSEINWGDIKGLMIDQEDLIEALDSKANISSIPVVYNGSFTVNVGGRAIGGTSANTPNNSSVDLLIKRNGTTITPSVSSNTATVNIKVPTFTYDSSTGVLNIVDNN